MLKWLSRAFVVGNVAFAVGLYIEGMFERALWHLGLAIFLVVTERRE